MGLIGNYACDACGYRSKPVLLGAYGDLYDLALGMCGQCAEIVAFDPDVTFCARCGGALMRMAPSEDGEVPCPRCGRAASLVGDGDDRDERD